MFSWAVAIIHTLRDLKIVSPRSVLAIRPSRHHFLTAPFGCVYSIRLRGQVRAGPENKVRPKQHRCMLVSHESSPEVELVRLWLVWGKSLKHARWLMTLVLPNLFLAQWFVAVAWCIAGIEVNFYSFDELQGAEMYLGMGGEGLLFGPWRNTISLENRFANGFLNGFFIAESTTRWMSSGKCVGSANFFGTTSTVLPAFTYILPLTIRVHNSIPTLKPSEVLRCQRCTESAAFAMPKAVLTRWRDFCGGKSFERKSSAVPTGRRCAKIESSLISSCCNWHHVGTNRFLYDICQDCSEDFWTFPSRGLPTPLICVLDEAIVLYKSFREIHLKVASMWKGHPLFLPSRQQCFSYDPSVQGSRLSRLDTPFRCTRQTSNLGHSTIQRHARSAA